MTFTHERENNAESEQHLYSNRKHFEGECRRLYDLLMSGKRLTVYSALVEHRISSLPRRYLDLVQAGVEATAEPMAGTRIKEYFCSESNKEHNKKLFNLK
jgi:hypothetical protein